MLNLNMLIKFALSPAIDNFNNFKKKKHEFCSTSLVHAPNFGGLSGVEDRGGGDNSIQFINIGRVGDKSFKEYRQKNKRVEGWVTTIF